MTSACGPADSDAAGSADKAAATTKAVRSALARVADRTEAARSARVEETIEGGADEPLSMRGAFTWNDDYAFDVETDAAGAGLEDVAVGSTIRVRRVDHTCYHALGQETTGRFASKEWLKVGSSCGDSVVDVLDAYTGGSPSALLKSIPYAHEVRKLGKETVNGQSATHYRTVMNQKDIAEFEDDHEEQGALLRTAAAGAESIPYDLWINADDLPVRTKQSTGPGPVTVTLDFEKFGTTEAIGTPPAEQTGDFTEEMRKASGM